MPARTLSLASIRPRIVQVEYAVRGEIVRRAQQIADDLARGGEDAAKYPFDKVRRCRCR